MYVPSHQTGGNLSIESTVGKGTHVEIKLPIAEAKAEAMPLKIATRQKSLLVEDDPEICAAVQEQLEDLGFDVTACVSEPHALALLYATQYDLLLSDLDLGSEIDGVVLADAERYVSAVAKTIIMSGKSLGQNAVPKHTGFIEQPVTPKLLIGSHEAMETRRASFPGHVS